jgi:2,4-dienoyl-CoA reductase-like NADH-dependent reductase (Old Yellow Enzyme family)
MSKLFETTKLNGMILKNRFVRSATAEGMALVAESIRDSTVGSTLRRVCFLP